MAANECTMITLDVPHLRAKKMPLLCFCILDPHSMSNRMVIFFLYQKGADTQCVFLIQKALGKVSHVSSLQPRSIWM